MKYLYKTLAVVITCCLAFSIPIMPKAVLADETTEFLYYEDFEGMNAGEVPSGIYSGKNAYASREDNTATKELAEVRYDSDKKSNYMYIADNKNAFQHAEIFFSEPVSSGTVVLEYDVYIENGGSGYQYSSHKIVNANYTSDQTRKDSTTFGLMNFKGHGGGGSAISTALYSGTNVFNYAKRESDPEDTDGVSYVVNKWQHCRLEIDLDNHSERLWVEGVRSLEQENMALNTTKLMDGIIFSTDFAPGRGAWKLDNIKVYKAVPSVRTLSVNSYTGTGKKYEVTSCKYDIPDIITTMVSNFDIEFTTALSDVTATLINTSNGAEEAVTTTLTDSKNCRIELNKKYLEANVQYILKINGTAMSGDAFKNSEINFTTDTDGGFVVLNVSFDKNGGELDWQNIAAGDTVNANVGYVLTDETKSVKNIIFALVGEKSGKIYAYNQIKANMDKTGKNAITFSAVLDEVPDKLTVYAWDMTTRTPIFDAVEIAAESPSEDLSNVTYEGVANKEDKITITVLAPDKTLDNLMEEGSTVRPLCYREVVADETGKYSANFWIGEDSDTYNVYTGRIGQSEPAKSLLKYVNKEKNKKAIDRLNSQGAVTADVIKENAKDLGVRKSLVDMIKEDLYDTVAAFYDKEKMPGDSAEKIEVKIEKAFAITLWNNSIINIFGDDIDAFSIPMNVSKWYNKNYISESEKSRIEKNVSKRMEKFADFDNSVAEETALSIIYAADGYGDVQTYLSENAELLGINKSKVTEALCRDIIGKRFDSVKSINIDNYKSGGSQYGGGSSKGSSGGSSIKNIYADIDKTQPKPIEPQKMVDFTDLSGFEWAKDAILNLYDKKIINGRAIGIFAPSENVLREEFAKMINGVADFEVLSGNIKFDDVDEKDWYYDAVKQMYLAHIIKGESENTFGSGKNISRQDMAVMCFNVLSVKGLIAQNEFDVPDYEDYTDIDNYAKEAVTVLSKLNIIRGGDNNCFYPMGNATRAEAAQMINNILNYINKQGGEEGK